MVILAVILTSLAAIIGILAVGSGERWQFTVSDYFKGRRNALLYLWVMGSTIFSICHSGALVDYGIANHWHIAPGESPKWMCIHATCGLVLTFAHIFVATFLSGAGRFGDEYLWGRGENSGH